MNCASHKSVPCKPKAQLLVFFYCTQQTIDSKFQQATSRHACQCHNIKPAGHLHAIHHDGKCFKVFTPRLAVSSQCTWDVLTPQHFTAALTHRGCVWHVL